MPHPATPTTRRRPGSTKTALGLALAVMVLLAAVLQIHSWLRSRGVAAPTPEEQRCVATAAGNSVAVDLDQAHFASIIVGLSVRRGLPPRAATIALTTAYQETGIRNLDYGDRDSVGLFQQRPSQGWGSKSQLRDPYYATGKFYDALVRIRNWRTRDITTVAQQVQRSGYPEAYRDHEADGRVLASTLTGRSPGGFTCLERRGTPGAALALVADLERTFGRTGAAADGKVVRVDAGSEALAWAYASYAVANSKQYGLVRADVAGRSWRTQQLDLPQWRSATAASAGTVVTLTVR